MNLVIQPFLENLGLAAYELNLEAYIVGGFTRNHILKPNKLIQDIDIVINHNAIDFTERYQRYLEDNHPQHRTFEIIASYPQFGTIKIQHPDYPNYHIELASTRHETYPEPADFPDVELLTDINADLPRRDFTINALLFSIMPFKSKHPWGEILDYVSGLDDIEKRLIRAFHSRSFFDDPTRIYRACRFAGEYEFEIESQTQAWIKASVTNPDFTQWLNRRKNRIAIELEKINSLEDSQKKRAENLLESLLCQKM